MSPHEISSPLRSLKKEKDTRLDESPLKLATTPEKKDKETKSGSFSVRTSWRSPTVEPAALRKQASQDKQTPPKTDKIILTKKEGHSDNKSQGPNVDNSDQIARGENAQVELSSIDQNWGVLDFVSASQSIPMSLEQNKFAVTSVEINCHRDKKECGWDSENF